MRRYTARPTTGWSLNEPTQSDSLISDPKIIEPNPAHHGLVG